VLILNAFIVLYTYELRSTYNVDYHSTYRPHGGIVADIPQVLMCSCATIFVLVICWILSSSFA
jgi:hypothetical protein